MSFVSDVESDQQGRDRLDRARIGEQAAINVTAAGNRGDERAEALFGLLVIAANNDVAFHLAVESGEAPRPRRFGRQRRPERLRAQAHDTVRRRPRPHAQDAGWFASHGRLERNGDVNDQKAGFNPLSNFFKSGDVRGEWNGQRNDRAVAAASAFVEPSSLTLLAPSPPTPRAFPPKPSRRVPGRAIR